MTPEELRQLKDKDAKEIARRLRPYLTTSEAVQLFEYYGHAVRERAEAEIIQRILTQNGY